MPGTIRTNYMTLQHADGTTVLQHLPCRLDPVNIDIAMKVGDSIPTDIFALRILNRTSPLPIRTDLFIDEVDGSRYRVNGLVHAYVNRVQCYVSRIIPSTP